ncbi:MAG: amino acid adenylation domain-containing protein, partial [Bacteroidota bacterium]
MAKPQPQKVSFEGETIAIALTPSLSAGVQKIALQHKTTKFVILLAAFKVLLYRYSGQSDLLIGSPFSNRDSVQLEKLIGFFNETVVLRSRMDDNVSFSQFVNQLKQTNLDALAHKNVPFEMLVKTLQVERNGSANPIFQVMFVYNNSSTSAFSNLDFEIEDTAIDLGVSKFDLTLFATDHQDYLELAMEYATDRYDRASVEQLLSHLQVILHSAIEQPEQLISKLDVLSSVEKEKILVNWNKTLMPEPVHTSIHAMIEARALEVPDEKAVVFEDSFLTYAQLMEQADSVANVLMDCHVERPRLLGLYTERSTAMIVGLLGILKAGAAYLPLDPDYPEERIKLMIENAGLRLILCQKKRADQLKGPNLEKLIIEEAVIKGASLHREKPRVRAEDLAYMIFTSGSSGKPKGVPISHHNLIHSICARFHFYDHQPGAFLLLSSFSFDSSVAGIFWTLGSGGTLVLPAKQLEQDIDALTQILQQHKVTHTLLLPSLYQLILGYAATERLQSLKTVMVAGEACSSRVVLQHFNKLPGLTLVNEYGPTEGTVWCTAHAIETTDAFSRVPIGKPIPYMENYILDKNLQPVPPGVVGELYIGGKGIARGYWKQPELSAQRFLTHPFDDNPQAKIYKTGDLAKFRDDSVIEFLGRADQQIKIRGHRVEPDEVKAVIKQLEGIRDAIVVVQKNNHHHQLIAYIITDAQLETVTVREALKEKLPKYMVPAVIILLDTFT